ncbi:MAG: rhodanese-like domain-containing protein [Hungatella sp.]|nr:rhodanese-like domain-containing protein [Hungatella sp.]
MRYPTISMRELDCWITCRRPMELIDLRCRSAYEYSHLRGAVNIPFEELEDMIDEECLFELQEGVPLVLYCARGGQSMLACNHLSMRGYPVVNVAGGMAAYRGNWLIRT